MSMKGEEDPASPIRIDAIRAFYQSRIPIRRRQQPLSGAWTPIAIRPGAGRKICCCGLGEAARRQENPCRRVRNVAGRPARADGA